MNQNISPFNRIVILTGAGISAESGIPVFRSETGLWEEHKVEDVATYEGFYRNKELVHNFYNDRRDASLKAEPNEAHKAIARLQKYWQEHGGSVFLVTQNIDNLHEKGGSSQVCHMHGELLSLLCEKCGYRYPFNLHSSVDSICPKCKEKSMRPDIVWFGEMPYFMDEIESELLKCSLFVSIGTSGVVYPAAGFCSIAASKGATTLELNLNKTGMSSNFSYKMQGKASVTMKALSDGLIEGKDLLDIVKAY